MIERVDPFQLNPYIKRRWLKSGLARVDLYFIADSRNGTRPQTQIMIYFFFSLVLKNRYSLLETVAHCVFHF